MNELSLKVFGKINLSLNITGTEGKFHTLDSVVCSLSVFDTISVKKRSDKKFNLVFNADFTPQNNTVVKAVNALKAKYGDFGLDVTVDKRLPLSGGMGGSSVDAAGVILALNGLYGFDSVDGLRDVCSFVGADVFYMLSGGYARLRGLGDQVSKIDCDRSFGLVCVGDTGVLTGEVYSAFDRLGGDTMVDNDLLVHSLVSGKDFALGNMLFRAACSLNPNILRNADAMAKLGLTPNMTGSGSTVYALCDDPIREAARLNQNGVRAFSAFTRPGGIEFF